MDLTYKDGFWIWIGKYDFIIKYHNDILFNRHLEYYLMPDIEYSDKFWSLVDDMLFDWNGFNWVTQKFHIAKHFIFYADNEASDAIKYHFDREYLKKQIREII